MIATLCFGDVSSFVKTGDLIVIASYMLLIFVLIVGILFHYLTKSNLDLSNQIYECNKRIYKLELELKSVDQVSKNQFILTKYDSRLLGGNNFN